LIVKFIGRQIAHPEFGEETMKKVISALSGVSKLEREPHFEGKSLIAILSPERKGSLTSKKINETKKEDKELSSKKV
jgi:translation initiation factor IF-3